MSSNRRMILHLANTRLVLEPTRSMSRWVSASVSRLRSGRFAASSAGPGESRVTASLKTMASPRAASPCQLIDVGRSTQLGLGLEQGK